MFWTLDQCIVPSLDSNHESSLIKSVWELRITARFFNLLVLVVCFGDYLITWALTVDKSGYFRKVLQIVQKLKEVTHAFACDRLKAYIKFGLNCLQQENLKWKNEMAGSGINKCKQAWRNIHTLCMCICMTNIGLKLNPTN